MKSKLRLKIYFYRIGPQDQQKSKRTVEMNRNRKSKQRKKGEGCNSQSQADIILPFQERDFAYFVDPTLHYYDHTLGKLTHSLREQNGCPILAK